MVVIKSSYKIQISALPHSLAFSFLYYVVYREHCLKYTAAQLCKVHVQKVSLFSEVIFNV